jgi:protoheme IX farnesyltransferase
VQRSVVKTYYQLTKPGIIYGNLLSATAGFLLASRGHVSLGLLVATLVGTSLVIACGCVLNNYIDRHLDAKMARTKKRALASGQIAAAPAIAYGIILGLLGFVVLSLFTNALTVGVGATGLFFYLVVYGLAKRRSTLGTVIGSVSGATPPVAGYVAVTGELDLAAGLLFLIMACWQMPHFYAIAMFRATDYAAAGLPVLPVKKGMRLTKMYILLYIAMFILAAGMLTFWSYTGFIYLGVVTVLGCWWFLKGLQGFRSQPHEAWGRKMFLFSLLVLMGLSFILSVDAFLP